MGFINGFCENKGFKTIIIANEKKILANILATSSANGLTDYKMIKEKTISRTILYLPDYPAISHRIIAESKWPSQEYADFLAENEQLIQDVFASEPPIRKDRTGKYHNFRSLNCALQEFSRIYELLKENQVPDISRYLYSFITYVLVLRSGIERNGNTFYEVSDEDIRQLYTEYSPETITEGIRQWIEYGIWDEDIIMQQVCDRTGKEEQLTTEESGHF